MFNTVLMPVDDVELAGRILWHVKRILAREGGSLTLLRAVKPSTAWERAIEAPEPGVEHSLPRRLDAAQDELEALSERIRSEGLVVEPPEVHAGDPAQVILTTVRRLSPSLVAMANHGRTGPVRWVLGSVAERVLRECRTPLLLLNPKYAGTRGGRAFRRILVPLDGSRIAEAILPHVADFAAAHESEVLLLRAGHRFSAALVYSPSRPPKPPTPAELEAEVEGARDRLRKAGLAVRVLTPLCEDVAEEILERAEIEGVDLVAMTTHGRSGLERWLFGSVAEKVLRHCTTPLLVERATGLVPWLESKEPGAKLAR